MRTNEDPTGRSLGVDGRIRSWITLLVLAIGFVGFGALPVPAGEPEPPVPPGTPTMKPLNELEPRHPIFAAMLPMTISQPGSYYLAESIGTTGAGITIDSSDVTIDLNGFSLQGGTGSGITVTGLAVLRGIVIRDGTVSGWAGWGIDLSPSNSITQGVQILDVNLRGNGNGLRLYGESIVRGCTALYNTGIGIQAGFGAVVTDSVVRGCTSGTALIAGTGTIVMRADVRGNDSDGVELEQSAQLLDSTVGSNDGHGVNASGDSVVIRNNTVQASGYDGIRVQSFSLVTGNLCVWNGRLEDGGAGIRLVADSNRVDDNHVKDNDIGLFIQGDDNVLARNSMNGNTQNWGRDPGVTRWLFRIWTVASPHYPGAWDNIEDNSMVSP